MRWTLWVNSPKSRTSAVLYQQACARIFQTKRECEVPVTNCQKRAVPQFATENPKQYEISYSAVTNVRGEDSPALEIPPCPASTHGQLFSHLHEIMPIPRFGAQRWRWIDVQAEYQPTVGVSREGRGSWRTASHFENSWEC